MKPPCDTVHTVRFLTFLPMWGEGHWMKFLPGKNHMGSQGINNVIFNLKGLYIWDSHYLLLTNVCFFSKHAFFKHYMFSQLCIH